MKKLYAMFLGLLLITLVASAQISTLPYSQSFDSEFTTGNNIEFIPNWTGNEVGTTNRIFRETTNFNSSPAALAIIPTSGFNGEFIVDLNLANYSNVTLSFVAKSMVNGTGDRASKLEISTSADGGANWSTATTIGEFPNSNQASFAPFSYTLPTTANQAPSVKVRFSVTTGAGSNGTRAKLIIDNVQFAGEEAGSTTPVLSLSPATLNFSQILGAPSATQSISVYGANLTEPIALTVAAPFEIALTEDGTYAASQTLSLADEGFSGNVFVRLNATVANDFTGTLTAQTAGITPNPTTALEGTATASAVTNPTPFDLSTGNYTFTEWSAASAAGTYPANMIFWTHAVTDPTIDVAFEEDYSCLYNLGNRSRIVGEGGNGVSFVNTGNAQYTGVCDGSNPAQSSGEELANGRNGAAVLALNTTGRQNIQVAWTGRTIAKNNRLYALRLQYRIGDGNGNPNVNWLDFETVSEYVANDETNHSQNLTATLPASANSKEVVQLRWVYYQHADNAATGSRAQLALDDITVSSDEAITSSTNLDSDNSFVMYPIPATDIVFFNKTLSIAIYDITGKKVLLSENSSSINISELGAGIYFVKTTEGTLQKLIVK